MVFGSDTSSWPAVQPQHERRKYLLQDGAKRVLKFEGLGRYGTTRLERARVLAAAGFGPPAGTLEHGFVEREWLHGEPLATSSLRSEISGASPRTSRSWAGNSSAATWTRGRISRR